MKAKQNLGKKLHDIFYRKGRPVMHVSAPSVYTAMMMEKAGFEYIFLGGDVTFGTMLGKAGVYMTLTEKCLVSKFFVDAVSLPVVVDADEVCGRGPAFHERAAEDYIGIGVAGMDIDDRMVVETRGASHAAREQWIDSVVSTELMIENIKAVDEVRKALYPDFLVRVRCYDFHAGAGRTDVPIGKSIERMQRYAAAGADVIYIGGAGVISEAEVRRCVKEVPVPCTVPATWMTYDLAKDIGLCEFRQPYEIEMAMHAEAWRFMKDFRQRGQSAVAETRERYKDNPYMALPGKLRAGPAPV